MKASCLISGSVWTISSKHRVLIKVPTRAGKRTFNGSGNEIQGFEGPRPHIACMDCK